MANTSSPEKKSWADLEEEEEAKAKAEAAAAASSSSSTSEPTVEAQARQIEALSLAPPEDDATADDEGPPLLDDSDDSQIQAVCSLPFPSPYFPPALALANPIGSRPLLPAGARVTD